MCDRLGLSRFLQHSLITQKSMAITEYGPISWERMIGAVEDVQTWTERLPPELAARLQTLIDNPDA